MHTRRTENDKISFLAWRTSETMPGATPRTQLGLEAATASGTGQRDFWSTGFFFTSAFYIFYNSMSRAQAATASPVPVLVAPHILRPMPSTHAHQHVWSLSRICHFSGQGGQRLNSQPVSHNQPLQRTHSASLPDHLHGQSPLSLAAQISALRGIPGSEITSHTILQPGRTAQHHLQ